MSDHLWPDATAGELEPGAETSVPPNLAVGAAPEELGTVSRPGWSRRFDEPYSVWLDEQMADAAAVLDRLGEEFRRYAAGLHLDNGPTAS